jgi:acyl-coenzyme A synthetase/AMP-(fatty) acid ligase
VTPIPRNIFSNIKMIVGFELVSFSDVGDLGWFDERGYLVYVGRKLEQIEVNGNLITPSILDGVLSRHPAIEMGVFYGVPGDNGQYLEAAVVLKAGQKATEDELKHWITSWIPTQVPPVIQFVSRLPLTSMGKLQRHKIKYSPASKAKL